MNMKRAMPTLATVAILGIAVYVGGSDRLAGEAGEAGCAGGELGVDDTVGTPSSGSQTSSLQKVDAETAGLIQQLAILQTVVNDSEESQQVEASRLSEALAKKGAAALGGLNDHLADQGCVQPGSAALAALIGGSGIASQVTKVQRQALATTLLDAALAGITRMDERPADDTFSASPQLAQLAGLIRDGQRPDALPGFADLFSGNETEKGQSDDCITQALFAIVDLSKAGLSDGVTLATKIGAALEQLPPQHPYDWALVSVARSVDPTGSRELFVNLTSRDSLSPIARELACRTALSRGAELARLQDLGGGQLPASLARCLVSATSVPQETLELALQTKDADARARASRAVQVTASNVPQVLANAFGGTGSDRPRSIREQFWYLDSVSQALSAGGVEPETLGIDDAIAHFGEPQAIAQALGRGIARHSPKAAELRQAIVQGGGFVGQDSVPQDATDVSVGSQLGRIARGEATSLLTRRNPSLNPQDQLGKVERFADATPLSVVAQDSFASRNCDSVVTPATLAERLERTTQAFGTNAIICLSPGTYNKTLELNHRDVRIVALARGVVFESDVLVSQTAVIMGLEIQGHVLVGDNARGSVFAFNKFGAGGVLGTSEVTFVSNSQPALPFVSPLGRVDTRAYTPSVAEILQEAFSLDDEAERDPYAHPDSDLRLQVALTKLARSGL